VKPSRKGAFDQIWWKLCDSCCGVITRAGLDAVNEVVHVAAPAVSPDVPQPGCKCVCHEYPQHQRLQDALEALRFHQQVDLSSELAKWGPGPDVLARIDALIAEMRAEIAGKKLPIIMDAGTLYWADRLAALRDKLAKGQP
jgi:hypothetical protein